MKDCEDDEDGEGDGEEVQEDRGDDLGEWAGADELQNSVNKSWYIYSERHTNIAWNIYPFPSDPNQIIWKYFFFI